MRRFGFAIIIAAVVAAPIAYAIPVGVTSAAALGANDTIDWNQFGLLVTPLSTPETWTSANGVVGLVGIDAAPIGTQNFERISQGIFWPGNFAPGAPLLYNMGTHIGTGDFVLMFPHFVSGAGAQIQSAITGPFTATVTAYDPNFIMRGSFSEDGISTNHGGNSAIFIGLRDTSPNIFALFFHVSGANDFAIGNVSLLEPVPKPVPEPLSISLLGAGLAGTVAARRRKKTD